ncbi:hypothetical protein C8Q78DRAFT_1040970 [Trametes maxima]|nr:hypothetical protein C8Q78DRAFT_1040970 [Trametes maxima]
MPQATTPRSSSTANPPAVAAANIALQHPNIIRRITEHVAPGGQCRTPEQRKMLRSLAGTSQALHGPATEVLWTRIPSVLPILLLLPDFYAQYHAPRERDHRLPQESHCVLEVDKGSHEWPRVRQLARHVRALLPDDGTIGPPPNHPPALVWSALRQLCHDQPLFPRLRQLHWSPHLSCCNLSLLLPPSPQLPLQYLHLDFEPIHALLKSGDTLERFYRTVRELLASTTMPVHLEFTSPPGDLWSILPSPAVLQQVRKLRLHASRTRSDPAGAAQWCPTVCTLSNLSALQSLQELSFELYLDGTDTASCSEGLTSLKKLNLTDLCDRAAGFLAACRSEDLRTLNLDVSRVVYSNTLMARRYCAGLCDTIATRFRHLTVLTLAFGHIRDGRQHEAPLSANEFSDALSPLLCGGMRGLSSVSISLWRGEYALSDAVLTSFAGAWPNLVSLKICSRYLVQRPPGQGRLYPGLERQLPATVTLRGLEKLARSCQGLRTLHLPCIHVPYEDNRQHGSPVPYLDHRLSELVVSTPYVLWPAHDRAFALALDRLFPRLDIRASAGDAYGKFVCGVAGGTYYPSWYQLLSLVEMCQAARGYRCPPGSWP